MASKQNLMSLPWPRGGLSEHMAFSAQEQANPYFGMLPTCVDCRNVRNYDPTTQRLRGAQRAGHTKYLAAQVNGANFVQHITQIVSASIVAASSGLSTRTALGLAVAGGTVTSFSSTGFNVTVDGVAALNATFPYLNSAFMLGVVYFVDGANYMLWTAATDTVSAWTETTGNLLPANGANKPRLICAWRGRIVLSGVVGQEQNWFMSAVGVPTDFNYGPNPTVETQAIAGNNAPAGQCQDVINALIPFNDDLLLFGCDHSIWLMTGDPMAGGRIDLVSDITGIAYGTAFCKDPSGLIYFFGSHGGLWSIVPGGIPTRLSADKIENLLASVDLSTNVVRLAWDDRSQSVHVYITPITPGATIHYVYDTRNKAFWADSFTNNNHNPSAVKLMQGDTAAARILMLGCLDGYLRFVDVTAKSDDGTAISSYVYLGPLQGSPELTVRLHELNCNLGTSSDPVTYSVFDGSSPEAAFEKVTARYTGTWTAGRNKTEQRWAIGNAIYVKLANTTLNKAWQFESMTAALQLVGRSGSRVF